MRKVIRFTLRIPNQLQEKIKYTADFNCRSQNKEFFFFATIKRKKTQKRLVCGGLPGARTPDPSIKSRMLYQLS